MSAATAWSTFGAFSGIEFDVPSVPDADGLLYQFGIYNFSGQPRFHLDLTRQFAIPDSDEYLQFHCDLQYVPTPRLEVLKSHSEWWFRIDGTRLSEWIDAVGQRREWTILEMAEPAAVEVYCDET